MSIPSIGAVAPRPPERPLPGDPALAPAPVRTPAGAQETRKAVAQSAPAPSPEQLDQAVANINKSLQTLSQDLEFSIDEHSNRTIVKIVDQKTKEVIRQIPSPEALDIAKALDTVKGLLIRQTA